MDLPRNLNMNKFKEQSIPVTKKTDKVYITWVNKSNNCWLNASLALIAHNTVMKKISNNFPESRIHQIIKGYEEAISLLNSSMKNINLARLKLDSVQIINSEFLKPILKYQVGDPESAFCSLYNILKDDVIIRRKMDVSFILVKDCIFCGVHTETKQMKPVLTLPNVDHFDPVNPVIKSKCFCNEAAQGLKIVYVTLPPCIIFHFENGVGSEMPPLSFTALERKYHLTSVMTLEKSKESQINHFITFIRDPFEDKWMDCNDLNPDIITFSSGLPTFKLEEICICVYESFDSFGNVTDDKYKGGSNKRGEEEIIDIGDDDDDDDYDKPKELSSKLQDIALSGKLDVAESPEDPVLTSENKILSNEKHSLKNIDYSETNDAKKRKNEEPKVESVRKKDSNFKIYKLNKQNPNLCNSTKKITEKNKLFVTETPEGSELEENYDNIKVNDNIMNEKSSENLDLTNNTVLPKKLDGNLALCSKSDLEDKEAFLSNAATNSSGASFVKVYLRRKKNSDVQFKEMEKSYSDCKKTVDTSSLTFARNSNESKRKTMKNKDYDYVPSNIPKKIQKTRKILKAKRQSMKERDKKTDFDISKFMNPDSDSNVEERRNEEEEPQLYSDQDTGANSNTENPNDSGGKVLEGFEKVWSCHDPNCTCDSVSDKDRIESIIKYSFAYFCKLSQEVKNFKSD